MNTSGNKNPSGFFFFILKNPVLFWVKKNLFDSVISSLLTLLSVWMIARLILGAIVPLVEMNWVVIRDNLKLILTGSYPSAQLWRIWLSVSYIALFGGASFGLSTKKVPLVMIIVLLVEGALAALPFSWLARGFLIANIALSMLGLLGIRHIEKRKRVRIVVAAWLIFLPVAFILTFGLTGESGFMLVVATNYWGGLLLSLLIALTSITLSFPIGLLLALGRRSSLKFIKFVCTVVIEVVRGVPLITILFIAYLIVPLALPRSLNPSVFIRAMVGIIMFHSAYMAEDFRGGLQGIPRTQYEAAASLNLSKTKTLVLVILPQVFKRMIPVLVSRLTGIIKDTSLISIIGLLDMIGISSAIISNPQYMTSSPQVLFFMAAIYFIICYSISAASSKIERNLENASKQAVSL